MKRKSQPLSKSSATKRRSQTHPSLWLIWGGAAIALAAVSWLIASLRLKGMLMVVASSPADPNRLITVDDKGWVYASRDGGIT